MPNVTDLPPDFLTRLQHIIPADALASVLGSFSQTRPLALRCNTLRSATEQARKILDEHDIPYQTMDLLPDTFVIAAEYRTAALNLAAYEQGLFYAHGLSSQLTVLALAPQPGEEVLDLCAAPGGKTAYIACMMKQQGRLAAVEKVKARFHKLQRNMNWQGLDQVHTYLKDGISLWRKVPERFDRVLLDAPCSSEARFDTQEPKTYQHWNTKKVKEMSKKQRGLAYSAVQALKPGGRLTYSTCSFAPEENELIIQWLLKKFPGSLEVEPIAFALANTQPGLDQWRNKALNPQLRHCLRILPNQHMSGFFICNLRKLKPSIH